MRRDDAQRSAAFASFYAPATTSESRSSDAVFLLFVG